jgi:uncharacterized membrane protein
MLKLTRTVAVLAAGFGTCHIGHAMAQSYTYTTISVPNSVFTVPTGINAAGTVLGSWYDSSYTEHGFTYANGTVTTFDDPNGVFGTNPSGINAKGEIVGSYYDASFGEHGFIYTTKKGKPVFTTVDAPGSNGTGLSAITGRGLIYGAGVGAANAQYVFTDKNGVFNTVIDANDPAVFGASDTGDLAGAYYASYPPVGFVYVKGRAISIPTAGLQTSTAYSINKKGVAVGYATTTGGVTTGFTFAKGKLTLVSSPGSVSSFMTGINDSGTIVGDQSDNNNNFTGFVDSGGTFTTLSVPNATSTNAYAINASGVIVGSYSANATTYVYIATPAR